MARRVPDHFQADPIIGVAQPISHTADIALWLIWHQLSGMWTKTMGSLTHSLYAAFDRITYPSTAGKGTAIHAS